MRAHRNRTSIPVTKVTCETLRLTVFIGDNDTWHHKPLFSEIVHRAHLAGLAGASVFHGVSGFGASSQIHTTKLLSNSDNLPIAVVIVDTPERVRAFLPELDELITEGLLTVETVQTIRYVEGGVAQPEAPAAVAVA